MKQLKYFFQNLHIHCTVVYSSEIGSNRLTSSPKYLTLYPAFDGYLDG